MGPANVVRASGSDRVRRDGTGQRPGLAGDGAGYRLPGRRPGHHQRASPGPCSPPAPSARCTSPSRSACPAGAPRAGRAGRHRGSPCSAPSPRCARSRAGSSRAAASTRPRAPGCWSTSATPCRPRASSRRTSSCRRCRTPAATGCARMPPRPSPGWPRRRTRPAPGGSASTRPTGRTPPRRRSTTSTSRSTGRTWTDTWYLRAGYSEHQTGLTVDLLPIGRSNCGINDCIDETPQGVWLASNAWRYGFILRYEKGRTVDRRARLRAVALPLRRHRAGEGVPRRRLAHLRAVPRRARRPDLLTAARPTVARATTSALTARSRGGECGNGRQGNHFRTHDRVTWPCSPRGGGGR